jgi:UDP-N-acetylmuramyl pentapeptide synthase
VHHFESSHQAASGVSAAIRYGDLVLVKGSRGTRCDVIVDRLVQEHG